MLDKSFKLLDNIKYEKRQVANEKNQKENDKSKEITNITEDNIQMYLDCNKVDEIKLANEGNFEVKVEF